MATGPRAGIQVDMASPPCFGADLRMMKSHLAIPPPDDVLPNGNLCLRSTIQLFGPLTGQFRALLLHVGTALPELRIKQVAGLSLILQNLPLAIPRVSIDGSHGIPAGLPDIPLISVLSKYVSSEANQHYDLRRNSSTHSDEYPRHWHSSGRRWDRGSSPGPCASRARPQSPPRCD